jgi:acetate kinase
MATRANPKAEAALPSGAAARSAATSVSSVLALNAGSSSIRYAVFNGSNGPVRRAGGKLELSGAAPAMQLIDWLETQAEYASVEAVGHRVVHGMHHSAPELVTPELIADLRRSVPVDPQHLSLEIELMEAIAGRHPALPQIACFDTSFHKTMARVATVVPIPRRYEEAGVRRYGFHGLSYEFLMQELARLGEPTAMKGCVILAHLGNGASLAAVRDGQSIDTSMGFTPTSGLVMGTRSGDLDPGVLSFLSRSDGMNVSQFEAMTNLASGLLGISETSADMRELLAHEGLDERAAEAIAVFCYQTTKWIGSFTAALGGLDTLVFAGGIGENLPEIRSRICANLRFLGVTLSEERNDANAQLISSDDARVRVYVIRTDEELMIAQAVIRTLMIKATGGEASETDPTSAGRRAI